MVAAVRASNTAAELLYGAGANEVSALWDLGGTLCKGRMDRITRWVGYHWVVDLKITKDARELAFGRQVVNFDYHGAAAWYLDGLNALSPGERRFAWVVVESEEPHGVKVYEPSDDALDQGRRQNAAALAIYRECLQTGEWPGYMDGVHPLELPRWARGKESTEL
jgi:hypothetical protein